LAVLSQFLELIFGLMFYSGKVCVLDDEPEDKQNGRWCLR